MGVYLAAAKHLMMDYLGTRAGWMGLLQADAGKAVTGVASTDVFTSTGHGYSNGDLVVLSGLTGGTGLREGAGYFVIASATNTFQLSKTVGGAAVNFTTDLTVGTVTRLVELTGGSPAYGRKVIAWDASSDEAMSDSTNGIVFDVPAGRRVDYQAIYSASSAGTLWSMDDVPSESFTSQGQYRSADYTHALPS